LLRTGRVACNDEAISLGIRDETVTDFEERMAVLSPHLFEGVSLADAAARAGIPLRTARRWLAAYRAEGSAGLSRPARSDRGRHRMPTELHELVEGLALRKPPPRVVEVYRAAVAAAAKHDWPAPSYEVVRRIIHDLDPGLVALAHHDADVYRDQYELVLRRESGHPNDIWQADQTQLDIMVLDETRRPARPWLTVVEDDHSRAAAGYTVFLEDPSAAQTSLAFRQAIWRKTDPRWPVCGVAGGVLHRCSY
jgi:putative transposase